MAIGTTLAVAGVILLSLGGCSSIGSRRQLVALTTKPIVDPGTVLHYSRTRSQRLTPPPGYGALPLANGGRARHDITCTILSRNPDGGTSQRYDVNGKPTVITHVSAEGAVERLEPIDPTITPAMAEEVRSLLSSPYTASEFAKLKAVGDRKSLWLDGLGLTFKGSISLTGFSQHNGRPVVEFALAFKQERPEEVLKVGGYSMLFRNYVIDETLLVDRELGVLVKSSERWVGDVTSLDTVSGPFTASGHQEIQTDMELDMSRSTIKVGTLMLPPEKDSRPR